MRMLVNNNRIMANRVLVKALDLQFKTTNDGTTPVDIALTKTGQAVDWDMGNGDEIDDTNSINYSGYTDSSEKTITLKGVDAYRNITELVADDDQLTDIVNLKVVKNLQSLNVEDNQLTTLKVSNLIHLEELRCANNNLTTLNLTNLSKLTHLDAKNNNISGTLQCCGSHPDIEYVYFDDNNLSGNLPDISGLSVLKEFTAANNSLIGSISALPNSLQKLWIQNNNLTGNVPNMPIGLKYLYAQNNNLTGTIPVIPNIVNLSLHYNQLTGGIPDITGKVIFSLLLQGNQLTSYGGGLDTNTTINRYYVESNLLPSSVLNDIIDDAFTNRITLNTDLRMNNNNGGVNQSSLYKIEGYGAYSGDGLVDNGWTVLYDIEYDDSLLVKFTTTKSGFFTPSATSTEVHVWDLDTETQESNTPSVSYPDATEKTIRLLASDYSNITRLDIRNQSITSFPTNMDLLTNLDIFYSWDNSNLVGPIPAELFHSNLRWFYGLQCPNIGGTVPSLLNATSLRRLYISGNNHIGELPSLENTNMEKLRAGSNNFTSVDTTGLESLNLLAEYSVNSNNLPSAVLNDIVDKLQLNVATLGSNSCEINLHNNAGGVDQDAIYKIEGYGGITGLIPSGCTVTYGIEFDDSSLVKITSELSGNFTPIIEATETPVFEKDEVFYESKTPTIAVTDPSTVRFLANDYANITRLFMRNQGITNFTNLDLLTNLESFYVDNNNLYSIDLSIFPLLQFTNVIDTLITELDVSSNPDLRVIMCSENNIGSIDISNQPDLYRLTAENCNLTTLDLSNNLLMEDLHLSDNNFTSIAVNHLIEMQTLKMGNNQLASIDISSLTKMQLCYLNDNLITDVNSIVNDLWVNRVSLSVWSCDIKLENNTGNVDQHGMYKIEGYGGLTGLKPGCTVSYDFVPDDTGVFIVTSNKTGDFTPTITSTETHVFYALNTLYESNTPTINFLTGDSKDIRLFALNDDYSNVTGINFNDCGLTGAFPDLTEFSNLTQIDFSKNALTGNLSALAVFTGLTNLDVSGNDLDGTIDLSPFTVLEQINLRGNEFSGALPIPSTTCRYYRAGENNFSSELFDLSTYDFIDFRINATGIHTYNGGITNQLNLVSFYIYSCNFSSTDLNSIIDDFYTIRDSVSVNLKIQHTSSGVDQTSLYKIEGYGIYSGNGLKDNGFTVQYSLDYNDSTLVKFTTEQSGTFNPTVVSGETNVWDLDTEIQESNTPSVVYPDATEKTIRLLASDYSNITELRIRNLGGTGQFPNITLLTGVETLYIDENGFTGSLPVLPSTLKICGVYGNQLTGNMPSLPASMERFICYSNNMSGALPDLSGNINLDTLFVHNNDFAGYNGGLDQCTNIDRVYLYGNQFTKSDLTSIIDDLYTHRATISTIQIQSNAEPVDQIAWYKIEGYGLYTGDGLKDNGCIVNYDMSYNDTTLFKFNTNINGTFNPSAFDSSETHLWDINGTIYEINAPSVALTGSTVPVRLFATNNDYSSITRLDIRLIGASGTPNWNLLTGLNRIYVNGNNFTGPLPDISLMPNMEVFSCYAESFSGTCPDPSSCSNLEVYKVYGNNLSGSIPNFGSNSVLRVIQLHINSLVGYPGGLNNCINLETIWLRNNQLTNDDLNNIVDDLFTIRTNLGANSCNINISFNPGVLTEESVQKIEGTNDHDGDGLKSYGCFVFYDLPPGDYGMFDENGDVLITEDGLSGLEWEQA